MASEDDGEVDRLRRRLERERRARTEAEAIAENATRRLFAADELKSQFVASVSHELRTPMAVLRGSVGALGDQWDTLDDDARMEMLGLVQRNTETLAGMIRTLLDFDRFALVDTAVVGGPAHLHPLDLSQTVTDACDDLARLFPSHAVVIDVDDGIWVNADTTAVGRIIANLVENAAKYTRRGSTVNVTVRTRGNEALLAIEDDGPGIPEDLRERVFERFFRAPSTLATGTRGLGIGLSIVRGLVGAIGGSISVEEGEHAGARFVVALPSMEAPSAV